MFIHKIIFLTFFSLFSSLHLLAVEPTLWGESINGVITRFTTSKNEVVLTFDACGGSQKSSQFDKKLIDYLVENKIKATLFINARWIDSNKEIFLMLAKEPLFEIENHGTAHRPLSCNGRSVYGINGTASLEEVEREIEVNREKIRAITGKKHNFFRSGTAFYDDVAIKKAHELGVKIAGFSVVADAGATFPAHVVAKIVGDSQKGDIIIAHMNHPESGTAAGMIEGIEALKKRGFTFSHLKDVNTK